MTRTEFKAVTTRSEERRQWFLNMFTTALEGGIGYWSAAEEYYWGKAIKGRIMHEDIDNFFARIVSNEDDWGVQAAYQPMVENGTVHPNFAPDSHVLHIEPDRELTIDIDVMERGWNLFMDEVIQATKEERAEHNPQANMSNTYFKQAVVSYLTDGEDGDYDATVADAVVQYGLFGEIVYA